MKKTKIEWCDSTWNPVTGCLHNCEYCYARRIAKRFEPHGDRVPSELCAEWGIASREQPGVRILNKPVIGRAKNGTSQVFAYPYGFKPTLHRYRLDEPQTWTKPRTIFVCSMADLFGDWVPDEWIEEVFDACEKAPQHRYLFLTKNPFRYEQLRQKGILRKSDNMWYGTSVTRAGDKYFYDQNHILLRPCYLNTFLSIEPLLEKIDVGLVEVARVNWIILGAETGNRKDKVVPEAKWIDCISKAAALVETPVFMKDSLIPIVGEENMRREFPWKMN